MDTDDELDKAIAEQTDVEDDHRTAGYLAQMGGLAGYSDADLVHHCYAGARTDEAFAEFERRHCANLRSIVKFQRAQLKALLQLRQELSELVQCLKPKGR